MGKLPRQTAQTHSRTPMSLTKIMFLTPVASDCFDRVMADTLEAYKYADTEAHVTSLNESTGPPISNLEYRTYEALVTGEIIRATHQANQEGFDALVIGCFYDTALHDAREISGDMIVVAPCHASIEIALTLANNFSIIVGQQKWVNQMQATVREYGYRDKLMSFRDVGLNVVEFQQDHNCTCERLIAAGRKAIEEDHAESLILGCTLETGFYREMEAELGVPVIDPTIAAFKAAEHAAHLKQCCGWKPSRKWGSEAPSPREISEFSIFSEAYEFGNRIVVPVT